MSRRGEKIFLGLSLLLMVILFISSAMTYSQQSLVPTLRFRQFAWLERWTDHWQLTYAGKTHSAALDGSAEFLEFLIRKTAHFGSYFLLGGFAYLGLSRQVPQVAFRFPVTWLAVTGYAATDEFHQSLTSERTPMIQDVMLDATGALCGLILVALIWFLVQRRRQKRQRLSWQRSYYPTGRL
ncbi:VanZ family protein [Lapidilactobacillus luobeiensis]|uniref:VanZ family protein n=1 Tax=Lapidilactobacillus luobeiensis TaxID=2950371 RepID=UPI0021C4A72F|nr:VanZ family protein [Lapidilactobacillus luobeiensis]